MPFKTIQGRADRRIGAPAGRCVEAAADAERWPDWLSTVRSVTPAGDGWLVQAGILGIPLILAVTVQVEPHRATIQRQPFGAGDDERFELVLAMDPQDGERASRASAQISAELELPRLLPVPGAIADQVASRVLSDLERRVTG